MIEKVWPMIINFSLNIVHTYVIVTTVCSFIMTLWSTLPDVYTLGSNLIALMFIHKPQVLINSETSGLFLL